MPFRNTKVGILLLVFAASTHAASINDSHPLYELFGVGAWDPSEDAITIVSPDGSYWIKTGDGRIRSGTWRVDAQGHICIIGGGVIEGCFRLQEDGGLIHFKNTDTGYTFTEQPRKDLPTKLLTETQQKFFNVMVNRRGAISTDRGGDEHAYLYRDGLITVVQPEGWVKTGGWWLTDTGLFCDDVNGEPECATIHQVNDDQVTLLYPVDGRAHLVTIRLERRH